MNDLIELQSNAPCKTITVVVRARMFSPVRYQMPEGLSIGEMLERVPGLPDRFYSDGVVSVDRVDGLDYVKVPRKWWYKVRPRTDGIPIEISAWMPPKKGAGSVISIVATIAIIVAAAFVAGPAGIAFFTPLVGAAWAGTAAAVAAAGVGIIGSMALRALSPPPSTEALQQSSLDNQERSASISGNVVRPGGIIAHVQGSREIFPPVVVKMLIELIGDKEVATVVFGVSGPHSMANFKADGVSFDNIRELEYETRDIENDNSPLTLVTRQSRTDPSVLTLSQHKISVTAESSLEDQTTPMNSVPIWHAMRADGSPDEIWINLKWPTGLFDGDAPTDEMITPVRVRMRAVGDTNWIRLPEIHFAYRKQEPFQKDIRIKWGTAPTPPTPKVTRAPYAAYSAVPMRFSDSALTQVGDWNAFSLTNANNQQSGTTVIQKTGSTASMYAGFRHATITRRAVKAIVWPHSGNGFAGSANVTIEWWGKTTTGAPASATDGALIATSGVIADTTSPVTLDSANHTTEYFAQWIRVVGSANTAYEVAEINFFDDGDWSWVSHSHFWTSLTTLGDRVMRDSTIGTTDLQNIALYEDRADVYLDAGTFPQGDYEIEIMRGTAVKQSAFTETEYRVTEGFDTIRVADLFKWHYDTTGTPAYEVSRDMGNVQLEIQRQRLVLIWNDYPLGSEAADKLSLLAVKVTDRQVQSISFEGGLMVPTWNGTEWSTTLAETSNPAAHARNCLVGSLNKDAIDLEQLDDDAFTDWYDHCVAEGYEVNLVVEGASAGVVAQVNAGCGYARIRQSEVFSVVPDRDRSAEAPVQIFTTRNSRGYTMTKEFPRRPSGLRAVFHDRDDNWKEKEIIVLDPDGDSGSIYEEARYDALVTEADVTARALHDMLQDRKRLANHQFESNGQSIKCESGDLIGLNHPVLNAAYGGGYLTRVIEGAGGNDTYTKSLLHFDGIDASTVFTDSNVGGSAKTWTVFGHACVDTAHAVLGTGAGQFDGVTDYATTPDHFDFTIGTFDLTIDNWFECVAISGVIRWMWGQQDGSGTLATISVQCLRAVTDQIVFQAVNADSSIVQITSTRLFTNLINTGPHHLAIVRTGGAWKMYIDGRFEGQHVIGGTVQDSSSVWGVGTVGPSSVNTWEGWLDEFRFSNGIARWLNEFTPPVAAYAVGTQVIGIEIDAGVPISGSDGFFESADDFIEDLYSDDFFDPIDIGLLIRLHDGNGHLTVQIAPQSARVLSRTLMFAEPVSAPVAGLDRDCLVAVGPLGSEYKRLIVRAIVPKSGPSYPADLICFDEAPELWA